jgi:hypothetical protein
MFYLLTVLPHRIPAELRKVFDLRQQNIGHLGLVGVLSCLATEKLM